MFPQTTLRINGLVLLLLCAPTVVLPSAYVHAEQVEFELNPSVSSVDLTAFAYTSFSGARSTRDTQSMPLAGTLTLDVDVVDGAVASVDFVALEFDYVVTLDDPTIHRRITLVDSVEQIPRGTEIEVHLPFDEDRSAGNPVPRFAPTLTLNGSGDGVESGTGGELLLTDPDFQFAGSGQYFNLPPGRDSVFVDGWPMDYGPYPTFTPFPDEIPGTEYIPGDPRNTLMTPAPEEPNFLDGTVSLVDGTLIFQGSVFSKGVGGAGLLQTAQIHEAAFFASADPFLPGDYNDDGVVDAADYTAWRDNVGAAPGTLPNDIDGGVIDDRQYQTWRAYFGGSLAALQTASLGPAVPEPTSLVVVGMIAVAMAIARQLPKRI